MSTSSERPIAPPPSPGWRAVHPAQRAESWVQTTLIVVVASLLFYVMAVPKARRTLAELRAERETVELRLALSELRAMIGEFRNDHGFYPGWPPGARRGMDVRASSGWFEQQLLRRSSASGEVESEEQETRPFGPYTGGGLPQNPVNGSSNVQVLGPRQGWPPAPDGTSGWTYSARTGEIRANCAGNGFGSRRRFWDL